MAEPVGSLRVDVAGNAAQFADDMAKIRGIVNTTAAQMQRSFLQLQQRANAAAAAIRNIGIVGALSVVSLIAFAKRAAKVGAEIDDNSQKLGISAEKYQELAYAAKLAGVEQEEFQKGMEFLAKKIGQFSTNADEARVSLAKIGLTLADVKGKDLPAVVSILAERIKQVPDPMQRAAIATEFFSRAGTKFIPMLAEGSAGLRKMADEARRFGFILSEETIKKAAQADDEFDRMAMAAKVAGVNLTVGLLPAITELRKIMTSPDFQEGVRKIGAALSDAFRWMVENKDAIIQVTAVLAGAKFGAGIGRAAGRTGSLIGAVGGAAGGLAAGIALTESEVSKLEKQLERLEGKAIVLRQELSMPTGVNFGKPIMEDLFNTDAQIDKTKQKIAELKKKVAEGPAPTKLCVSKQIDTTDLVNDEKVRKAIEDLTFKTRLARGEFKSLAEGFPEAAHGLGLFGTEANKAVTSVEELSPRLKKLNDAMKEFKKAEQFKELGKGIADALGSAFENAIIEGKKFGDILKSLEKDLLRLLIRTAVTKPLGDFLGPGIAGLFAPGKAMGGPVMAGHAYTVGERGRELFVPSVSGSIIPNSAMKNAPAVGGGTVVNIHEAPGTKSEVRQSNEGGRDIIDVIMSKVDERISRGGFDASLGSRYAMRPQGIRR